MTTRDKLTFVHAMARSTRATVRQCEALMRFAQTYRNVLEWEKCEPHKAKQYQAKRLRIANKIGDLCGEIAVIELVPIGLSARTCVPLFAGPVLKIRTPGGEEIVCPS